MLGLFADIEKDDIPEKVPYSKLPYRKKANMAIQVQKALGTFQPEAIPEKVLKDKDPLKTTDPRINNIMNVLSLMRLRSNITGGSKTCPKGYNYYIRGWIKHVTRVIFNYFNTTQIQDLRPYNAPLFSRIDDIFTEIENNLGKYPMMLCQH